MEKLTNEFIEAIKNSGLYHNSDCSQISELSKKQNLREGKGYTQTQIRNVIKHQFSTTKELIALIMTYYDNKLKMRESIYEEQKIMASKFLKAGNNKPAYA